MCGTRAGCFAGETGKGRMQTCRLVPGWNGRVFRACRVAEGPQEMPLEMEPPVRSRPLGPPDPMHAQLPRRATTTGLEQGLLIVMESCLFQWARSRPWPVHGSDRHSHASPAGHPPVLLCIADGEKPREPSTPAQCHPFQSFPVRWWPLGVALALGQRSHLRADKASAGLACEVAGGALAGPARVCSHPWWYGRFDERGGIDGRTDV